MSTIPFEKLVIFKAVRTSGFVDIPETTSNHHVVDEAFLKICGAKPSSSLGSEETTGAVGSDDGEDHDDDARMKIPTPISLQRRETMSGNIVVIEPTMVNVDGNDGDKTCDVDDDDNINASNTPSIRSPQDLPVAYWLQRRLGNIKVHTLHGSVIRLAYKLRMKDNSNSNSNTIEKRSRGDIAVGSDSSLATSYHNCWELDMLDGKPIMVMILILQHQILDSKSEIGNVNPLNELSALQLIYQHNPTVSVHVINTRLISMCRQSIYCVLPYYHDGSLFELCQSISSSSSKSTTTSGPLEEPLARFLFRQIMQGLKTLQEIGLCHRNLSLESILLDGDRLDICDLGWAMRFNPNVPADEDHPFPLPGGTHPQFIPPEYFRYTKEPWDGFRGDLWAAGLILYTMVVGTNGLFTAPISEDKSFVRLCVKGDIRGQLKRYGTLVGRDFSGMSDELVDLLQKMMRADPNQRLTLDQVLLHPWLMKDEAISLTAWKLSRNESL